MPWPDYGIAWVAPAKSGSSMLRQLTIDNHIYPDVTDLKSARHKRIGTASVPAGLWRIGVVRHPVSRFYSLWRNVQERPRSEKNFYKRFEGLSPRQMWDELKVMPFTDYHFQPQWMVGLYTADQLIRLEDFDDWFITTFSELVPPQHLNVSVRPYERDPSIDEEVLEEYRQDFELWERANGGTKQT